MESVASIQPSLKRTPAQRRESRIFGGILALLVANLFLQRATLVDQLHPAISILSGSGGFALGVWIASRLAKMPSYQSENKRVIAQAGIAIFAIFIGTYLARVVAEELAFVGLDPAAQTVEAKVTDIRTGHKWPGHYASFMVGDSGREIEVKVTSELYDSLEPWRSPGRDCLLIQVEQGRGGLRRTVLPNLSFDAPLGVDHYRRCTPAP